jgi:glucose/arabinose dehydrogenase
LVSKQHCLFFLALLITLWLLVFPSITIGRVQQQDPLLIQQLLPKQTAVLSQQPEASDNNTPAPTLDDSDLEAELVTEGLESPTSMAFIGNHGDMLILEKSGEVILFTSENMSKISLLNLTVNDQNERGLLGVAVLNNMLDLYTTAIAASSSEQTITTRDNNTISNVTAALPSSSTPTFVFFYFTEASKEDRSQVLGNRIYRFEWNDTDKSLSNGTLILDLPVLPGQNHNGGKLVADSENRHIYAVIGDLNRKGMLQNFKNGSLPDDTSVILRINPDGSPAQGNPFLNVSRTEEGSYSNLSKYYAYGIRNSFGLAIDPVTGILWDTENGPDGFDEINVVRPGFNSGWAIVMGPIERSNLTSENDLVNFLGSSSYADPVFSWGRAVGVTDIEFYNSDKLGNDYTNNIFVGDANNGHLYFFEVNEDRSGLQLEHPRLADDLVASNERQRAAVTFGTGFPSSITDVETGPDGYLYVLTFHPTMGTISRIMPQEE